MKFKKENGDNSNSPCFFKKMLLNKNKVSISTESSLLVERNSQVDLDGILKDEEKSILNKNNTIKNFALVSLIPRKIIKYNIYKPILKSLK